MAHALIVVFVSALAVFSHTTVCAADSPVQTAGREAEAAFRDAISAWSYSEYGRLWSMGLSAHRFAIKDSEFEVEMRKGRTRPQGGNGVEALRVVAMSGETAALQVRLGLERGNAAKVVARTFTLQFEDGAWRVSLYDFLSLSRIR